MIRRAQKAAEEWVAFRDWLRRWPWIDLMMAYVLFGWAVLAFWHWQWIVTTSRFYSFYWVIHYMAFFVGAAGILQAVAGVLRLPRTRRVAAFLGLWAFTTFMANVFSPLGALIWSAFSFTEFLLLAAIL